MVIRALGQENEPMQDYHMNPILYLKYKRGCLS